MTAATATAHEPTHHRNIFKSMKELDFKDTVSHQCGITMNDSVEARAIAEFMGKKPGVNITYQPALKGVAEGKPFSEIFDTLSPHEDLTGLRDTFRRKAFQKRQEGALIGLRHAGWADDDILTLDCGTLEKAHVGPELTVRLTRYLDAMRARFPRAGDDASAFVTSEGAQLSPAELPDYLNKLRAVRINMEFNGALCRGLKKARYREKAIPDGDLTLVEFIDVDPGRGAGASAPPRR